VSDEAEIKADIEVTRAELAETADLLAAKLDEKAQAGKRVGKQVLLGITGGAVLIVIVQRIRISRRNGKN
jgi:Protein of unknown function (DUF3618)